LDKPRTRETPLTLTDQVRQLESELLKRKAQLERAQQENQKLAGQVAEMETAHANLISLFVAMTRLHASLDYVEVVRTVGEIATNLIGATAFGIYLLDSRDGSVATIKSLGCDDAMLAAGKQLAAQTLERGQTQVVEPGGNGSTPLAAVPLRLGDRPMGAIVLCRLLAHKKKLEPLDFELFELLGKNASTALYGAKLDRMWKAAERLGEHSGVVDLMPPPIFAPRRSLVPGR
jgi:hypothetical protein